RAVGGPHLDGEVAIRGRRRCVSTVEIVRQLGRAHRDPPLYSLISLLRVVRSVVQATAGVRAGRRYGAIGVCRPLTSWGSSRSPSAGGELRAFHVASLSTVWPGSASCCSRWHRFTASPTRVYSTRSSLPSSAAATVPVLRPIPRPKGGMPSAS